ncbi:DUF397 domain-containing protein [Saccharopolyspora sp. CA-218241]|uniref:DUF397 domain-containing protein n=1 Tax=Saccharopolyspora sp. CA-218241 TaxID=3240027 RepID=UPI003D97EAD4
MSNTIGGTEGAKWRKSSRSGGAQQCVEVATNLVDTALIRDSKLGDSSPVLGLEPTAFSAFVGAVRAGRFDG